MARWFCVTLLVILVVCINHSRAGDCTGGDRDKCRKACTGADKSTCKKNCDKDCMEEPAGEPDGGGDGGGCTGGDRDKCRAACTGKDKSDCKKNCDKVCVEAVDPNAPPAGSCYNANDEMVIDKKTCISNCKKGPKKEKKKCQKACPKNCVEKEPPAKVECKARDPLKYKKVDCGIFRQSVYMTVRMLFIANCHSGCEQGEDQELKTIMHEIDGEYKCCQVYCMEPVHTMEQCDQSSEGDCCVGSDDSSSSSWGSSGIPSSWERKKRGKRQGNGSPSSWSSSWSSPSSSSPSSWSSPSSSSPSSWSSPSSSWPSPGGNGESGNCDALGDAIESELLCEDDGGSAPPDEWSGGSGPPAPPGGWSGGSGPPAPPGGWSGGSGPPGGWSSGSGPPGGWSSGSESWSGRRRRDLHVNHAGSADANNAVKSPTGPSKIDGMGSNLPTRQKSASQRFGGKPQKGKPRKGKRQRRKEKLQKRKLRKSDPRVRGRNDAMHDDAGRERRFTANNARGNHGNRQKRAKKNKKNKKEEEEEDTYSYVGSISGVVGGFSGNGSGVMGGGVMGGGVMGGGVMGGGVMGGGVMGGGNGDWGDGDGSGDWDSPSPSEFRGIALEPDDTCALKSRTCTPMYQTVRIVVLCDGEEKFRQVDYPVGVCCGCSITCDQFNKPEGEQPEPKVEEKKGEKQEKEGKKKKGKGRK